MSDPVRCLSTDRQHAANEVVETICFRLIGRVELRLINANVR